MCRNEKFLTIYPVPVLLTPLPLIPFITEKITGCTNEAAKGANKAPRNPPSFFISFFTVSVTPSSNTMESSNGFIIFIVSFISLIEINKVNPFPSLTTHFPLIFLSNVFIALEVKLLINPGKLSLAKGIATFASAFFLNKLTKNQKICLIEIFWIFEFY